ncbi:MAG: nickel-dependent lactate racemase [Deltaproteobacteria bacterium]|nr:nickel-dependent lactate racemase [Deltaproteobacteria bacterium]
MKNIFIRYQGKKTPIHLPPNWKLLTFAAFEDHPDIQDVRTLIRQALRDPIGSRSLKELLSPSDTVAIIIEDQTRSSPKKEVLNALLDLLEEIGIAPANISIIIALGTHRMLSAGEMAGIYGNEAMNRYTIVNHDCYANDLVPIGRLRSGSEVKINRRVYEASFTIGIGSIFPHPMNGFGGGCKILFPGVANFHSILEHHLRHAFRDGSDLGRINGNPFYEEVRALAKAGGLDFIINSVLDHNDRLYDLVCGDPMKAHMDGIRTCRKIITKDFKKQSDVTIITAFPYSEGPQIMKPLAPASMMTKEGGFMILCADLSSPIPPIFVKAIEDFRRRYHPYLHRAVFDLFDKNRRISEEAPPELNMAMAQLLMAQDRFRVILVTEDMDKETVERLGFAYAKRIEDAFSIAEAVYAQPEVHVIPAGGVIIPVMDEH